MIISSLFLFPIQLQAQEKECGGCTPCKDSIMDELESDSTFSYINSLKKPIQDSVRYTCVISQGSEYRFSSEGSYLHPIEIKIIERETQEKLFVYQFTTLESTVFHAPKTNIYILEIIYPTTTNRCIAVSSRNQSK